MKKPMSLFLQLFLLLALLVTATAAESSEVGKARMVLGKVLIRTAGGQEHRFRRGNTVSVGDVVITNTSSQAQLIMVDGSNISVRPGSQFKIEEFVATGDVEEDKTHYQLLKGAIRSITGSIGHKNKASYQLKTPVATMGIRGTDFIAKLCNHCSVSDGLYVHVISGGVAISNKKGKVLLNANSSGYASSSDSKPLHDDSLPINLFSPGRKDKPGKPYPSPDEEMMQIGFYTAPENKKEFIKEAMDAGVSPTLILNAADSAGLKAKEIVPLIINEGKKQGKTFNDLIHPLFSSDVPMGGMIKKLMVNYPDSAMNILTEAFAAGKSDNIRLRAEARSMGISEENIKSSETLGHLLSVPDEFKNMLDNKKQSQPEKNDTNNEIRSRELAPKPDVQTANSPS